MIWQILFGLILIFIGLITLNGQIYLVLDSGRFLILGAFSSIFIVFGIAAFFIRLSGSQMKEPDGNKKNKPFKKMPKGIKVTVIIALLAGVVQLSVFQFAPLRNFYS